jgi:galactose mutarotase-like enzyme
MTGKGADADGQASLAMGGAFEAPWAGRIWGSPAQTSGHITTVWRGHAITLSDTGNGATNGLMLTQPSDTAGTTGLPDGGEAQAVYRAGDYGVHWPSKTEVTVTVLLSSRAVDLTVVARNVGDTAEPIGIGWHPRFAVFGGNRAGLRLRVPAEMRAELRDQGAEQPTGKLLPVAGTPFDFTSASGTKLGMADLDEYFVDLHQELLDNGPQAELSDPSSGYGLRMTALSPTIKAIHVTAPANADFVSIEPQYNYPDPFGREWSKEADSGMVVLQPGQSTEWKVRLELFTVGTTPPL